MRAFGFLGVAITSFAWAHHAAYYVFFLAKNMVVVPESPGEFFAASAALLFPATVGVDSLPWNVWLLSMGIILLVPAVSGAVSYAITLVMIKRGLMRPAHYLVILGSVLAVAVAGQVYAAYTGRQ